MKVWVVSLWMGIAASSVSLAPAQNNSGTVSGYIRLAGKSPGNPVIRMGMDPKCSAANAGRRVIQEYVIAAADGSVANVFVRLIGNFPSTPVPSQPVVIDQAKVRVSSAGCWSANRSGDSSPEWRRASAQRRRFI
jgi:hypothetical protein